MSRTLNFGRKAALGGKARSMVIFLHGYGADGADLLGLADPLAAHLADTVFLAPDAPSPCASNGFGRQWFGIPAFDGSSIVDAAAEMNRSADDLNAFIDAQLAAEGLRPETLVLLGFSQGAMMAMHVAPRRTTEIAGVVAISGRLLRPEVLRTEMKVKPPVLLVHGDQDPVVDFREMGLAGNALVAAGVPVFGHVMHGTGHGIAPDGLQVALAFLKERLPV